MESGKLKPMSMVVSAMFFGAISLYIAFGLHLIVPIGKNNGYKVFTFYYGTLFTASLFGIVLSIILYNRDKKRGWINSQSFSERFWIRKITLNDFLWGFALLVFWIITLMLVKASYSHVFTSPDYLQNISGVLYGVNIKGSFWLIPILSVFLIVNIAGEELFWRGYMLPRQEIKYGKKAWIINGLLWSAFHAPLYWIAPTIAPGCIALSFVTQKTKSIWPAIIAHFLLNGTDMLASTFTQI